MCFAWRSLGWVEVGRPGAAPGGAPSFLARTIKEGKRSAPRWLRPRSFRCGATWVGEWAGWAAELTSRLWRFVQTAAASQITKQLHPTVQPPPRPVPDPGASRRGWKSIRAIASLGLGEPSPLPSPKGRGRNARVGGWSFAFAFARAFAFAFASASASAWAWAWASAGAGAGLMLG